MQQMKIKKIQEIEQNDFRFIFSIILFIIQDSLAKFGSRFGQTI